MAAPVQRSAVRRGRREAGLQRERRDRAVDAEERRRDDRVDVAGGGAGDAGHHRNVVPDPALRHRPPGAVGPRRAGTPPGVAISRLMMSSTQRGAAPSGSASARRPSRAHVGFEVYRPRTTASEHRAGTSRTSISRSASPASTRPGAMIHRSSVGPSACTVTHSLRRRRPIRSTHRTVIQTPGARGRGRGRPGNGRAAGARLPWGGPPPLGPVRALLTTAIWPPR